MNTFCLFFGYTQTIFSHHQTFFPSMIIIKISELMICYPTIIFVGMVTSAAPGRTTGQSTMPGIL